MPAPAPTGELTKAYLEVETGARIDFLFNPAELSIQLGADWGGTAGKAQGAPTRTYQGGKAGIITLNLIFDTTSSGDSVTQYTDALGGLLAVDTSLKDYSAASCSGRPPSVRLCWGQQQYFSSIATSLQITFTYFSLQGTPLRATAALTLEQLKSDATLPLQNPTSHTPALHRAHAVRRGETLDRIAAQHYGDPSRWRDIAAANAVVNPFAVRPGTVLAIPERTAAR